MDSTRREFLKRQARKWPTVFGMMECAGTRDQPVLISELTDGGGRMVISRSAHVPDAFLLNLQGSSSVFCCQIIWRSDRELGFRFVANDV